LILSAFVFASLNTVILMQRMEWVLARELRSDGYAVWQK